MLARKGDRKARAVEVGEESSGSFDSALTRSAQDDISRKMCGAYSFTLTPRAFILR
jgi:hypothetical protein